MSKRQSLLLSAALSVLLSLPAAAQEVTAGTVVASVNGQDITMGHMVASRMALPDQYQTLPDDVLFQGILEQLIQQTLLSQAMGELSDRINLRLENQRRSLIADEMIGNVLADAVTDEALQAAYDTAYADAEPTREWNASHILVETEDAAKALVAELEAGADFAELAMANSTGPSGPNGGALGWFGPGMMVKPFEDAVLGLEAGQITTQPVQTQFGWHVVKLNETRMQGAPALEEVRDALAEQILDDALATALKSLEDAATITRADTESIDPVVLRDETLID